MTIIGLKELRENTIEIANRVARGESFVVIKRSKPIFQLTPVSNSTEVSNELQAWTTTAIERYRPALEVLADK